MNDRDRQLLEANMALAGPTLRDHQPLLLALDRLPLCAICPAGQWYVVEQDQLHCFCTQFRGLMYGGRNKAVIACDARVDALTQQ